MRYQIYWLLFIAFTLSAVEWYSLAQDFDVVISTTNRKSFTIVDQVKDPAERKAFLALYGKMSPREKAKLAEDFLGAYPQSWLLAQVYEIAAKSYIDLEDYPNALRCGKESLRLLPESPLLLVPLANVQARQSFLTEAKQNAIKAMQQLDRLSRPDSIPEREWPDLERQLKASTLFVLGRVAVSEAFGQPSGEKRKELLRQSERHLLQARALNPLDPEIPYLMGLSYLSLGKVEGAATSFAIAYQLKGTMQPQALQQLRRIYETSNVQAQLPFETFLDKMAQKGREPASGQSIPLTGTPQANAARTAPVVAQDQPNESPGYAGSAACRQCHLEQHQAWQQTGMSRMFRPYRPENVLGEFSQNNEFYAGEEVKLRGSQLEVISGKARFLFARMVMEEGRHYFQIKHSDGRWVRYPVDYTIGSKWQQAYATRLPNGQIHVFPIQYNALHRRWINFWKIIDTEGSERADVSSFEKLGMGTSYQANCAVCHTSQLRNIKGRGFEFDNLEFRETGINCEMCHGPSARHVAAMTAGKSYTKQPLEPPVDFNRINARDYVAICAQCHMQSAMRESGPLGELNFSGRATAFFQRSQSRPLAEFSRKAFYKDGRFRETTFIVEALYRTACFQKGQVSCGHCHDPHGQNASANPKSLKFLDQPDRMCLQCHSQFAQSAERHTRHPIQSEGSRCVSCHMPPIMNSLLFQTTHQIDDIPEAAMTLRFGSEESPNACLLCHTDRGTDWLKQQLLAYNHN